MELQRLVQATNHADILRCQGALRLLDVLLGDGPELSAVADRKAQIESLTPGPVEGADYMDRDHFTQ